MRYEFGDIVKSIAVGKQPEFIGKITYVAVNQMNVTHYHVVDDYGYYWNRVASDLTPVNDNAAPTQVGAA